MTTTVDFSFAAHSQDFDQHIEASIPGYINLTRQCVGFSRRFIQSDTRVVDIGCSTGRLIESIYNENKDGRPRVSYTGIDVEERFKPQWEKRQTGNLRFEVADARKYDLANTSLAISLFTVQFIPPRDKQALLKRLHDGLVPGGALIISEKVLAETGRFQDALTFPYYDHKLREFSEKDLLDKERSLRGQMVLWTEQELVERLHAAGFRELQLVWSSYLFVGYLALA